METRPETEPEVPIRGGQIWRSRVIREITVLNGYHGVIHQTRKRVTSAQLDGRIGLRISPLSQQEIPNQRMLQRNRRQIRRGLEVTRHGISCTSRSTAEDSPTSCVLPLKGEEYSVEECKPSTGVAAAGRSSAS